MTLAPARGSQRWHRLLPLVFVTCSFAYLDRSNYSLGAAGGLTQSLHVTSATAGLLGGPFFAGYFLFQIPAARYAQRRSVTRLLFWSLGVYGFVFWLPTIIKGASHQGIGTTGALSAIPYAAAAVLMLITSQLSDRSARPRAWFVWPFLLAGAVAFYLSCALHGQSFAVALILLVIAGAVMYAPYGPYFACISESLPGTAAGVTVQAGDDLGA